ncbi:hypothetical protein N7495_002825 [Penicillium taxi]|uniref:uncharacterized protein n=1 Tax=Penicillium taxi TaxID=168475 RepID=UPI0025453FCE|nr:uncharacterized protein N7495_002825 [Penicillium taxi]KAJ5902297.1 hypothetical protein N7495_002825 [Penicillium taxi]
MPFPYQFLRSCGTNLGNRPQAEPTRPLSVKNSATGQADGALRALLLALELKVDSHGSIGFI